MIHYRRNIWSLPFCAPGWMPQHEISAEELTHDADRVDCPDCLEAMAAQTIQALEQDVQDALPRATFLRYEYQPSTNAAAAAELGRSLK